MFAVLIHVGQTPNVCGGKCPIYSDGTFKFVPIAVTHPRSEPDPTFRDLGLADYVLKSLQNYPAFKSPEFETLTYSHITRAESDVYERLRNESGFLVFFSSLFYSDTKPPVIEGISPNRGAYIIGYFKVEGVYYDVEVFTDTKLQDRFKANGQFGRKDENGRQVKTDCWISGSAGQLFSNEGAVPLTEVSDPLKWNSFARNNLTTSTGKSLANYPRAKYNWTLVCPSQNLDSLRSWIQKFTRIQFARI